MKMYSTGVQQFYTTNLEKAEKMHEVVNNKEQALLSDLYEKKMTMKTKTWALPGIKHLQTWDHKIAYVPVTYDSSMDKFNVVESTADLDHRLLSVEDSFKNLLKYDYFTAHLNIISVSYSFIFTLEAYEYIVPYLKEMYQILFDTFELDELYLVNHQYAPTRAVNFHKMDKRDLVRYHFRHCNFKTHLIDCKFEESKFQIQEAFAVINTNSDHKILEFIERLFEQYNIYVDSELCLGAPSLSDKLLKFGDFKEVKIIKIVEKE